jgi:hypothetical protein
MKVKPVNERPVEPGIEVWKQNPPLRFRHLAPRSTFGITRKVVQMSRQRHMKIHLKFIATSDALFGIDSASQILALRDLGVSTNAISAMLRRDGSCGECIIESPFNLERRTSETQPRNF